MTVAQAVAHAAQPLQIEGSDAGLECLARSEALALTPRELREIVARIGRNPTRAEAHAFAIAWSEHCSYKSSRPLLERLPTKSSEVLVPVGEDAGVLRAATIDGVEYGVVVAHESHNHPAQVVPFEGAATGIGGILRDVLCMGAVVVASADPLRFGEARPGNHAGYVAASVVEGIAAYGNAVGVPNLAGDVYFHPSFDDNCLVNVVALGFVRADRIIHSRVPPCGDGYDLVLVGKATDASGFGGAAFASLVLDVERAQADKSAVQVPDPFLKSVIMRASYAAFELVAQRGIQVGFKDLGAGGIMGSSSELCGAGGFGATIDIDAVPQAVAGLPPFVVACAETQERMLWAVPPSFSAELLALYNERFTLGEVSAGARAAVIGKVTKEPRYRVLSAAEPVMDLPIDALNQAPLREHASLALGREKARGIGAEVSGPKDPMRQGLEIKGLGLRRGLAEALLSVLAHPDVCSRRPLIDHYDTAVRAATVIPSGYADAGVIIVKRGARAGIALSVDGNPRYGAVSARAAAAHAVVEAARNVAAVGAMPIGLTDCLNYGDPEDPVSFAQLADGVDGLTEAARALTLGAPGEPLPFVSGNVSLYNESAAGRAIAPSAIVACIGRVDDVGRAVAMQLTGTDRSLLLLGRRTPHLGGSVFAALEQPQDAGHIEGELPPIDYQETVASIRAVVEGIRCCCVSAAHDVSDGGVLACVAEMCLGGDGTGTVGARLLPPERWAPGIDPGAALFGEAGGFVVEVGPQELAGFHHICKNAGVAAALLGTTGGSGVSVDGLGEVALYRCAQAWTSPLRDLFA